MIAIVSAQVTEKAILSCCGFEDGRHCWSCPFLCTPSCRDELARHAFYYGMAFPEKSEKNK